MKFKKLTALITSAMLAVVAVPANTYAEDVIGDWYGGDNIIIEIFKPLMAYILLTILRREMMYNEV